MKNSKNFNIINKKYRYDFSHTDILCHHSVTSWHLSSRRGFSAPFEGSCRQCRLRGGLLSFISSLHLPPLRTSDISPQGEAFRLHLRRACRQRRLRGGLLSFIFSLHLPPLRHFGHLSSRRGFSAPFEGSCRQRRLRVGISHHKNYIHNFITFHPHCQATNITFTLRFA